jgi:hypothetical protein
MAWGKPNEVMVRVNNTAKRHASRWEGRAFVKQSASRHRRIQDRVVIREQKEDSE